MFCRGSKRYRLECLIYGKMIIVLTPNLKLFPYSKVISHTRNNKIQANERSTKINETWSTIKFDVSDLSLIFFIPMSLTISVINRSGACYSLHESNWWHVYWCKRIQSHVLPVVHTKKVQSNNGPLLMTLDLFPRFWG